MSGIIKAGRQQVAGRDAAGVAFNFDDITAAADARLEDVRQQAAKIIADAKQEANQIRAQAVEEGKQMAQQTIKTQIAAEVRGQMQSVLPALDAAVQSLNQSRHEWITQWEKEAVHLAVAIAERVIRRQLSEQPEITLGLVREALELAAGSGQVQLHLHPADHETLGEAVNELTSRIGNLVPAEVVADPEVSAGGCLVTTEFGAVDQRIESQLARIEEELT